MQNKYDIIVIGAGLSGLTFANEVANKSKKVLLLEAKSTIGGCLHTLYHTDKSAWVELGAHTFYNKYIKLIELIERLDLDKEVVPRQKKPIRVFSNRIEKITSQINRLELFFSLFRLFTSSKKGKTIKEYYAPIVGKRNYNKVFYRMFNTIAVQHAENFSAEYFLKKRKLKNKDYPKTFLLKNGMSSLIDKLAASENITIQTNFKATECVQRNGGFEVKNAANETVIAKDICFAATPQVNGNLLKEIHQELSDLLLHFPMQQVESRGLFMAKDKAPIDPIMFLTPLEGKCFSMVSRDVLPHSTLRGFSFHFEQDAPDKHSIIHKVLGTDNQQIPSNNSTQHQLPLIPTGHAQRLEKIKTFAKDAGIYLVGNYFNGLSLEDCVERALEEADSYQ